MYIRWVLDLARVSAVVGKLDLFNYDGGVTAHDISGPRDALPEHVVCWRKRSLVEIEHLKKELNGFRCYNQPACEEIENLPKISLGKRLFYYHIKRQVIKPDLLFVFLCFLIFTHTVY